MNRTPENGRHRAIGVSVAGLRVPQSLLNQLFTDSGAASWGLSPEAFAEALEVSAKKRFSKEPLGDSDLAEYLSSLHLRDLGLACACAEGDSAAWNHFVATYRGYLRSAAAIILRCPADSPAVLELADSLFAELYGIKDGSNRGSLFHYFHGRSSLKTWLRAIVAQRHTDAIRASRRFTELDSADGDISSRPASLPAVTTGDAEFPHDPHRADLVELFHRSLEVAFGLLPHLDRERLRLYYAAEQTLAEIGRSIGEHESTVSRNLDRTRRELRQRVEQTLRSGNSGLDSRTSVAGLSDAQIALCFEYASEDAAIDLDKLLPETHAAGRRPEGKK